MAYNVPRANGTFITVDANLINTTSTNIPLIGQNVTNYGTAVAQAFVQMLENFAHTSPPATGAPSQGQLWFDTNGAGQLRVRVGSEWRHMVRYSSDTEVLPVAAGHNIGASGTRWGTVYAETFDASGADLAERYEADAAYAEGTLVRIGGENEITATTVERDEDVFGVISLSPGLGLNTGSVDNPETNPYVAIAGRVPVRVIGTVRKGQRLVTSMIPGVAMAAETKDVNAFMVIGRALEEKTTEEEGLVLTTVGAK